MPSAPADERPRNSRRSGELMAGTAWYGTKRETRTAATPPPRATATVEAGESRVQSVPG
jgi:hypothetical protein